MRRPNLPATAVTAPSVSSANNTIAGTSEQVLETQMDAEVSWSHHKIPSGKRKRDDGEPSTKCPASPIGIERGIEGHAVVSPSSTGNRVGMADGGLAKGSKKDEGKATFDEEIARLEEKRFQLFRLRERRNSSIGVDEGYCKIVDEKIERIDKALFALFEE